MKSFLHYLTESVRLDRDDMPPEPGTTPIPSGMVRGYHYTDRLQDVLRSGLDRAAARGSTYGEPNVIWLSTVKPGTHKSFVEVFVSPKEIASVTIGGPGRISVDEFNRGQHDFYLNVPKIAPDRFVTFAEPWHDHYRYLQKNYPHTPESADNLQHILDNEGMKHSAEWQAVVHWFKHHPKS